MIRKNPSDHLPVVKEFNAPLLDQAASDSPLYADVRLLERVLRPQPQRAEVPLGPHQ